ncbi:MAG: hypothetical protein ACOH2M_27785 [Cypionkella sp.]
MPGQSLDFLRGHADIAPARNGDVPAAIKGQTPAFPAVLRSPSESRGKGISPKLEPTWVKFAGHKGEKNIQGEEIVVRPSMEGNPSFGSSDPLGGGYNQLIAFAARPGDFNWSQANPPLRKVRPGLAVDPDELKEGNLFLINVPTAEALVEAEDGHARPPDLFALTRLAFLWDVTPADDYASLFPWRLHFAAARFLGRLHQRGSNEVVLDADAHWGLRALRYDVLDDSLDSHTFEARAWLRHYMTLDEDFWAREPKPLQDLAVRPAWRFLAVRKARRGAP